MKTATTTMIALLFKSTLVFANSGVSTEAGYGCPGGRCVAQARPQSNLMRMCEEMKAMAAWASDWQCSNAAYYNNSGHAERASILRLREKNPNNLTAEERAILEASNRTGALRSESCGATANALLVKIDGQDAILTSAHQFNGQNKVCTLEQLRDLSFYPNISYYDPSKSQQIPSIMDNVSVDVIRNGINVESLSGNIGPGKDWLIIKLPNSNLSTQTAPDGRVRGHFKFDTQIASRSRGLRQAYPGYILGMDDRYSRENGGMVWSYQACNFHEDTVAVRHSCDTSPGSSSSMLGVYSEGEIRLTGIHNFHGLTGDGELPESSALLNTGLLMSQIESQASVQFAR